MKGKQYPYVVYHLDRERLDNIERHGGTKEESMFLKWYLAMLSNSPRSKHTDLKESRESHSMERMNRKCESCLQLMGAGLYKKVCSVDTKTAAEVVEATTDINEIWFRKKKNKFELHDDQPRSTQHYDIIKRFDTPFIWMPLGFINLEKQQYETGIT